MAKKVKIDPPLTLTMRLFEPGMSMMHRAGLGGLACTLKYIERAYKLGELLDEDVPGGPWNDSIPPWYIEPLQIKLDFGEAEKAKDYLKKLFTLSFQLKDDLIYLPGQYGDVPPSFEVRSELQKGITLSFLQHGGTRKLSKDELVRSYDYDDKQIQFSYKVCSGYKHQEEWGKLCDNKGMLNHKPVEVIGPLNPGAVVRHIAYGSDTKIEETVDHILPLFFALVGCLVLPINRGSGVLIVPEVSNLQSFATMRKHITPETVKDCKITGAGDAALQAQLRLKAKQLIEDIPEISACYTVTFEPTPWASQQKSRVKTMLVPPGEEIRLTQFAIALAELSPRVAHRTIKETKGRGKNKETTETIEYFWADSVVRPLVADNLAQGKRWYEGFQKLMIAYDPVSKKPLRDKVKFEKKGLNAMTQKIPWEDKGESVIVQSVHEAIRRRYAQIAEETKENPVARKKRRQGEYDKWRLAFSGAKTAEQFRYALCDLWSRAGINRVLKEQWKDVLPMLDANQWHLARDLSLLGLASYSSKGSEEIEIMVEETEANETQEN